MGNHLATCPDCGVIINQGKEYREHREACHAISREDEANRDQLALQEAKSFPTEQLVQFAELVWELASDRYQQPYPFSGMTVVMTMVAGYRTGDYVRALQQIKADSER